MNTIPRIPVASDNLPAKPTRSLDHLPGPRGHRLKGNLESLLPNPGPFLLEMQAAYGNCFTVGMLLNRRVVIWMGETAHQAILTDRVQNFSSRGGWDVVAAYFGRNILTRDFEDHRLHRQAMTGLFKRDALARYEEMMQPIIDDALDRIDGTLDVYVEMKRLALEIAIEVFAGVAPGPTADAIYPDLVQVLDSVLAPHIRLPGTRHWKGMNARNRLKRRLRKLLDERRAGDGDDLFTRLARHRDDDGRCLADDDVVDHMLGMLFAAHDTTASAMAMMLALLARHPEWQQRLNEEPGKIDWVLFETLRLFSPVQFVPRRNIRAFEADGIEVPPNAHVLLPMQASHMNPACFTEPNTFDPERFANPPKPHTFYPFGRGAHMCIGMHFALLEVRAVMTKLLDRYELEPIDPIDLDYLPVIRPLERLAVGFRRA